MKKADAQYFYSELASGLQERVIVTPFSPADRAWHLLYLQAGAIIVQDASGHDSTIAQTLKAPFLLCLPSNKNRQLKLLAGSSGTQIYINEIGMAAVLGSRPEAVELRVMVDTPILLPLDQQHQIENQILQSLSAVAAEIDQKSPGYIVIMEAQLRTLIVHLWRRAYHTKETLLRDGPQTLLLRQFRQLVEIHYRDRWRVSDYASALNTTSDRLHDIAKRSLRRAPLDLIHERSHREAKALLTRSNMNLDQIAAFLGFKTTAQFSTFFRKLEGMPPGKYRVSNVTREIELSLEQDGKFDDWP